MLRGALRTKRTESKLELSCSDRGNEGLKQRQENTNSSPERTTTSWGITSNSKQSKEEETGPRRMGGGMGKKKMDTISHGHPQAKPMPHVPDANLEGQSKHPHYRSGSRAKNNTQIQPCLLPDRGLQHLGPWEPTLQLQPGRTTTKPAPPPPGRGEGATGGRGGWPTNTSRCPVPPSRSCTGCRRVADWKRPLH